MAKIEDDLKIVSKFHVPIFYTFLERSCQRALWLEPGPGRTGSSFQMIQLVLIWSKNFESIFFDTF